MTILGKPRPRVFVVPHVPVIGGAGLYNRAAIDALAHDADVTIAGAAADAYAGADRTMADVIVPSRPVVPAYAGASRRAFLFHAALAPFRFVAMRRWARRHAAMLAVYDAVVATSSIDLLLLRAIAPTGIRQVCIVQENAFLSGLRGTINRILLRQADTIVAISETWAAKAKTHEIASIVAPNPFTLPSEQFDVDDARATTDLLFMGGSERIKGIELFLALVERLAAQRPVRAVLLGQLTPPWTNHVAAMQAALAAVGSTLATPGFVADTTPFLRDARLLLLPITDPHFCRPAVEAGLCGRTFVVSRLPDLDDFAQSGDNCLMAPRDDIAVWHEACVRLLDDAAERHRLAEANRERSLTRFSPAAFVGAWHRIVATWR